MYIINNKVFNKTRRQYNSLIKKIKAGTFILEKVYKYNIRDIEW